MPNNLAPTNLSGVLPNGVFTSFVEQRIYPMLAMTYHDGSSERSLIEDGVNPPDSIKTWRLSVRRLADDVATLRTFYEAVNGPLQSFYFYDPYDVAPGDAIGSNWDGTGVSTQGRRTVKFLNQSWTEVVDLARTNVQIELIEVA